MSVTLWPEYGLDLSIRAEFGVSQYRVITEPSEALVISVVPYLKGDPGDAAAQFIHTQSVPSNTWIVNHNKGYRPLATVYSVGWVEIEAAVTHVSENQLTVQLNNPQAGYVLC